MKVVTSALDASKIDGFFLNVTEGKTPILVMSYGDMTKIIKHALISSRTQLISSVSYFIDDLNNCSLGQIKELQLKILIEQHETVELRSTRRNNNYVITFK